MGVLHRSSRSVAIQDTLSSPNSKQKTSKSKLKGVQSLTPAEKEAADIMQALKESKKSSRRQPGTGGSNKGTGTIPGVPYESTVVSATSSEGTGTKLGVPDEEKDITEEKVILEWGDEEESKFSYDDDNDDVEKDDKDDDKDDKDDDADDEGDDRISDTQDTDDEDAETERRKKKEELIVAAKHDAEKSAEEEGDAKKVAGSSSQVKEGTEFPLPSSSLSVSSGFCTQFINSSFDISLTGVFKDTTEADVSSLMDVHIQQTPHIPSPPVQQVLVSVIPATINLPPILEILTENLVSTALRVAKLEKDVFELKNIYLSTEALAALKTQVPSIVDKNLRTKTSTVYLEQESEKSPSEILKITKEQAEMQKMQKFTIKSTNKAALEEYDMKSTLYRTMHTNKSFNRNPANYKLYHALMEALIEDESAMDKGVADTIKDHKRKHDGDKDDDDEDPPAGPN
ncbi:hypothetical protein Tco_0109444 [Tanacetum coccineum]